MKKKRFPSHMPKASKVTIYSLVKKYKDGKLIYEKGELKKIEAAHGKPREGTIKSEEELKAILDGIFKNKTALDNYRPGWLKNPETGYNLELDRYYPDLKLGFEFGGSHHLKPKQRHRDRIKRKLARKQGVAIIYVYWGTKG